MSPVAFLALKYLSTLTHKGHYFQEDVIEHKMCFDFLYNVFSDQPRGLVVRASGY